MSRGPLLLLSLALSGCGGADRGGVEQAPSVARTAAAPTAQTEQAATPASQPVAAGPQRAPARKRSVDYRVVGGDAGSVDPGIEGVGRPVGSASADAEQLVDLPDGTRLRLAPLTELWAFEHARSLLLVSGRVRVSRLPDAPRAGIEPTRIATWAGAVEVIPGADFVLRVEAQLNQAPGRFRAQLGMLRGGVVWTALDDRGGDRGDRGDRAVHEQQLLASEALPANVGALQVVSAPRADPVPVSWERAFRTQRLSVLPTDFDAALDAALAEQQHLHDTSKALLASLTAGDLRPPDVPGPGGATARAERERPAGAPSDQQRALIEHSRRKLVQRSVLLLAAERSLLVALRRDSREPMPAHAAARAWAQRFAGRLTELL